MAWSIALLANTVQISDATKDRLFEAQEYEGELWDERSDVSDELGRLGFNPDHSEHMDWIGSHGHLLAILREDKVKGDICFGSLEGDNAGSFWGYRLDGEGGMVELRGTIMWEEKKTPLAGKTVVVTGKFGSGTRQDVERLIAEAGGKVGNAITRSTNLLIVGRDPGSKLAKARALGVECMSEQDFMRLIK